MMPFSSIVLWSMIFWRDGFVADSLSKELPNPDLFVSFLIRTEDVTERVLQAIPVGTKEK